MTCHPAASHPLALRSGPLPRPRLEGPVTSTGSVRSLSASKGAPHPGSPHPGRDLGAGDALRDGHQQDAASSARTGG